MALPIFPTIVPRTTDPLWFDVDTPTDDDALLTRLEKEQQDLADSIAKKDIDLRPIGTTATEHFYDEDDDEEDDDGEDEDESDTNDDDELDGDMLDDRDSPIHPDMDINQQSSPQWMMG